MPVRGLLLQEPSHQPCRPLRRHSCALNRFPGTTGSLWWIQLSHRRLCRRNATPIKLTAGPKAQLPGEPPLCSGSACSPLALWRWRHGGMWQGPVGRGQAHTEAGTRVGHRRLSSQWRPPADVPKGGERARGGPRARAAAAGEGAVAALSVDVGEEDVGDLGPARARGERRESEAGGWGTSSARCRSGARRAQQEQHSPRATPTPTGAAPCCRPGCARPQTRKTASASRRRWRGAHEPRC